ncbi:MAG: sulfur carrier protein ThiS [Planctomycetota bacterium]
MQVTVNGERRELGAGCTISELLEELDIRVKHVAVERNREVVPRADHADTVLAEGDELEVVTLVGGG